MDRRTRRREPDECQQAQERRGRPRGLEQVDRLSRVRVGFRFPGEPSTHGDDQPVAEGEGGNGDHQQTHGVLAQVADAQDNLRSDEALHAAHRHRPLRDPPDGLGARALHLALKVRAAVTGLGLQRAHLASQPGRPVEDLQNLVAGRPELARQRVAAPRYGLDALQDSGRCVARPGRLEPRGRLRVVTGKLVQVGVQGLRPRRKRLGRGGQAPIGPSSRSRQIEQVVELQHVDGGVGEDMIGLWEIPLHGLDLDCQRVDLRAGCQPPLDPLLAHLERLSRGEYLRHGQGCAGFGGRLRRFGAASGAGRRRPDHSRQEPRRARWRARARQAPRGIRQLPAP